MHRRDRETARSVARYLAQWLAGVVAVGAFTLLGLVALMNGPELFLFHLKRGALWPLIVILLVSMSAWLLLRVADWRAVRDKEGLVRSHSSGHRTPSSTDRRWSRPGLGLPPMGCLTDDLPLLELLCTADEVQVPGELKSSLPHENTPDAIVDTYVVAGGRLLLTFWRGRLHEVIYQTPAESAEDASRRNDRLFTHYGQGDGWIEILDNGFGKTYRRADQQQYALWSYAMDITTFGTMDFHQVKW